MTSRNWPGRRAVVRGYGPEAATTSTAEGARDTRQFLCVTCKNAWHYWHQYGQ